LPLPLVALAATLAGCTKPAADNLLFISFDTTRADHLSAYGYRGLTSPAVASLAKRGAKFLRAYSDVPSTLPAHSTMFTGLLPPEHGVRCNGKYRLPAARTTLAELLSGAGFDTAAVLGAFPLDSRFGLDQGFAVYDDDFASSALTAKRRKGRMDDPGFWIGHEFVDFERGADEVTNRAIGWLSGRKSPWFLFVHYFDPHWPYEPPDAFAAAHESAYDAEIASADYELGRLLDVVDGMPGRTLVVFTADHGEGLGDHGEQLHNRFLYDSTLHVPLIMALEGTIEHGLEIGEPVGHVDLFGTLLELLGVKAPGPSSGRSLVPLFDGGKLAPTPLYAETLVPTLERPLGIEVRALVDGPLKLVRTDTIGGQVTVELYDLIADPGETNDLSRVDAERTRKLLAALDARRSELERSAVPPEPLAVDEGTEQRLKSLGYL
jgi:arylsulfatase A-like enzyme